jgi:hypothetical protein
MVPSSEFRVPGSEFFVTGPPPALPTSRDRLSGGGGQYSLATTFRRDCLQLEAYSLKLFSLLPIAYCLLPFLSAFCPTILLTFNALASFLPNRCSTPPTLPTKITTFSYPPLQVYPDISPIARQVIFEYSPFKCYFDTK